MGQGQRDREKTGIEKKNEKKRPKGLSKTIRQSSAMPNHHRIILIQSQCVYINHTFHIPNQTSKNPMATKMLSKTKDKISISKIVLFLGRSSSAVARFDCNICVYTVRLMSVCV